MFLAMCVHSKRLHYEACSRTDRLYCICCKVRELGDMAAVHVHGHHGAHQKYWLDDDYPNAEPSITGSIRTRPRALSDTVHKSIESTPIWSQTLKRAMTEISHPVGVAIALETS